MSGEPEVLALTVDEFEVTARRITHQWMRHLGYKQHAIDGAEQLVEDDTPIDINDPAADAIHDLLDSGELVMFVMERLAGLPEVGVPVAARDEAAELRAENDRLGNAAMMCDLELTEMRAAIKEWAEATDAEGAAHHNHGEGRITTAEYFEAFERFDAARSALRRLAGGEQ